MTHYDSYCEATKSEAVKLARELGAANAARELGIPRSTITNWLRKPKKIAPAGAEKKPEPKNKSEPKKNPAPRGVINKYVVDTVHKYWKDRGHDITISIDDTGKVVSSLKNGLPT
jgi:transposase